MEKEIWSEDMSPSERADVILQEIQSLKGRVAYLLRRERGEPNAHNIPIIRARIITQLYTISILSTQEDRNLVLRSIMRKISQKHNQGKSHSNKVDKAFIERLEEIRTSKGNIFFLFLLLEHFHIPIEVLETIIIRDYLKK